MRKLRATLSMGIERACGDNRGLGGVSGLHHGNVAAAMRGVQPALNIHGTERVKVSSFEK